MELFYRKHLAVRRTYQTTVWTFIDTRYNEAIAEVFIREPGGLRYLREHCSGKLSDPAMLFYVTYQRGKLSPRPFIVQYVPDESVFYSVLALAVSCCKAWNLDPVKLVGEADPSARITDSELCEFRAHARWENTVFPGTWDAPNVEALCDALDQLHSATLAALIRARTVHRHGW